jgi:hypothetical protein
MFTVHVGSLFWEASIHEPFIVALICPLLASRPWQVQDMTLVVELKDQVSGVWSPDLGQERAGLLKFWMDARKWDWVC